MQAAACRRVAALFDAGNVAACRVSVGPLSRLEFAEALACYELKLIATGDDPVRISLQMAVMRTARDPLRVCAAIDALPEALSLPSPDTADAIRFARRPSARGAAETGHDSVAAIGDTVRDQPATVVRTRRDLVVLLTPVGYPNGGDERPRPHSSSARIQQTLNLVVGQGCQFPCIQCTRRHEDRGRAPPCTNNPS